MNWRRIWSGTFYAAALLLLVDIIAMGATSSFQSFHRREFYEAACFLILPNLLQGFLLCWLYVLARPRLGPGPKTALITATVAFGLGNPQVVNFGVWKEFASPAFVLFLITWMKWVAATYLAGWQYIEKAP